MSNVYPCPVCGKHNKIVNQCGCDPDNLPTVDNMPLCPECGSGRLDFVFKGYKCLDCGHAFKEAAYHTPKPPRPHWLVIRDDGSDHVSPKRADWTEVEGKDAREAGVAFLLCTGELSKMRLNESRNVHVRPASSKLPCVVHTLTLVKTEDKK